METAASDLLFRQTEAFFCLVKNHCRIAESML